MSALRPHPAPLHAAPPPPRLQARRPLFRHLWPGAVEVLGWRFTRIRRPRFPGAVDPLVGALCVEPPRRSWMVAVFPLRFEPMDAWVGVFHRPSKTRAAHLKWARNFYACPLPCLVLKVHVRRYLGEALTTPRAPGVGR